MIPWIHPNRSAKALGPPSSGLKGWERAHAIHGYRMPQYTNVAVTSSIHFTDVFFDKDAITVRVTGIPIKGIRYGFIVCHVITVLWMAAGRPST